MKIELRDPNTIMKLSRLGSFHQSKLSFLRSFLSEFKDWDYNRDLFNLDQEGYGEAVYSFKKKDSSLSLKNPVWPKGLLWKVLNLLALFGLAAEPLFD